VASRVKRNVHYTLKLAAINTLPVDYCTVERFTVPVSIMKIRTFFTFAKAPKSA